MMIDTHAHAHFNAYKEDMDEVIKRSLDKGTIVNLVGTQIDTSRRAVEVANKYDGVYATVGLHPEHLFSKHVDEEETSFQSREENFDYEAYKKLAQDKKVIGIGECGLDFYRIPEGMTKETMLPKQRETFLQHIKLAQELSLPLVIHCREGHEELKEVLRDVGQANPPPAPSTAVEGVRLPLRRNGEGRGEDSPSTLRTATPPVSAKGRNDLPLERGGGQVCGTMHCYTSNWANAEVYLDMGFYIGFTGVITFPPLKKDPKAQHDLLDVVKRMPLDRILLETDCPYLSPIPYRGKRGEPWMIEATAQKIAELRGISFAEVIEATNENAKRLFTKIVV